MVSKKLSYFYFPLSRFEIRYIIRENYWNLKDISHLEIYRDSSELNEASPDHKSDIGVAHPPFKSLFKDIRSNPTESASKDEGEKKH
jgi:hypothetical protein